MLPLNTPAMVRTLVVLATLKYSGLLRRRGFCGQDFCLLHKCQLFIRARFDVDQLAHQTRRNVQYKHGSQALPLFQ